ncbi:hypothetical protein CRENBAI_002383 [Crenichthys baileyi]|uniref:Uncharacterized protein n=1 Tax=Crenichthys baileyi TaxID=28760 RepID=A0AAV9S8U3_9TELE
METISRVWLNGEVSGFLAGVGQGTKEKMVGANMTIIEDDDDDDDINICREMKSSYCFQRIKMSREEADEGHPFNRHLNVVEGFECSNDPRGYVVWGLNAPGRVSHGKQALAGTYIVICYGKNPRLIEARHSHSLLSADWPRRFPKATGVCTLKLGAQLDTFNQVVWARAKAPPSPFSGTPEVMLSGQTIPQACQAISETDSLIPQRTAGVPIRLTARKGQKLQSTRVFFQPLPYFRELNLVVCGTPMLELNNCSTYLLVENPTQVPIQDSPDVVFTFPSDMITIERHEVLTTKSTCGATLGAEGNLVVYAQATHPGQPAQEEPGTRDSPLPLF